MCTHGPTANVRKTLMRVNMSKAVGPENTPGHALRTCANQLVDVITDISLIKECVPNCCKTATIVVVRKKVCSASLNDFHPVALTSILMKCFEKLVLQLIENNIPASLDLHQFAFRTNRSTEDDISTALHSVFLENNNKNIRMLFVDFSSVFNTISPMKLIDKLSTLGLSTTLCNWILDFPTKRSQTVRIGGHTSSTLMLNTRVPQLLQRSSKKLPVWQYRGIRCRTTRNQSSFFPQAMRLPNSFSALHHS